MGDPRRGRGRRGEQLARDHLARRGYDIIQTNFHSRYGEIDIIARKGDIVAFVEVKARRDRSFGEPFESVSPRKQSQIRRMARAWLMVNAHDSAYGDCCFRFDVISIMLDKAGGAIELDHMEDAFR